jgi:hypothetical protein
MHSSLVAPPPYALATPTFRFRALGSLAGRAAIGGPREVALATYLVARLVDDCQPSKMLPAPARAERAAAARTWLAGVALPTAIRSALAKLVDATAGDPAQLSAPLSAVMSAIDSFLDSASRLELERLSSALEK